MSGRDTKRRDTLMTDAPGASLLSTSLGAMETNTDLFGAVGAALDTSEELSSSRADDSVAGMGMDMGAGVGGDDAGHTVQLEPCITALLGGGGEGVDAAEDAVEEVEDSDASAAVPKDDLQDGPRTHDDDMDQREERDNPMVRTHTERAINVLDQILDASNEGVADSEVFAAKLTQWYRDQKKSE